MKKGCRYKEHRLMWCDAGSFPNADDDVTLTMTEKPRITDCGIFEKTALLPSMARTYMALMPQCPPRSCVSQTLGRDSNRLAADALACCDLSRFFPVCTLLRASRVTPTTPVDIKHGANLALVRCSVCDDGSDDYVGD